MQKLIGVFNKSTGIELVENFSEFEYGNLETAIRLFMTDARDNIEPKYGFLMT